MADRRIVQCFGTKRQRGKPDKPCGRRYIWTARGASAGNFGSKGVQACPHCGTMPEFRHPLNIHLANPRQMSYEEALAAMPAYNAEKSGQA